MHDPQLTFGTFCDEVHAAAVASELREVEVDLRELRFANSSSIRSFVTWLTRISELDAERWYHIVFVPGDAAWQRTTLPALMRLFPALVKVKD
jgi:hypothetical protein